MNSNSPKTPEVLQQVLAHEEGMGRIVVGMQAFADFSLALRDDLEMLVARWAHTAAPRSSRTSIREDGGPARSNGSNG